MKVTNFQDDIPFFPNVKFRDHYVLVFDLTSMKDASDNSHNPKLIGEPPKLELNFTFPLEHVTELIVLGQQKRLRLQLTSLVLFETISKIDNVFSSKYLTVSRNLVIGNVVQFPLTMFQLCHFGLYKYATKHYAG